MDTEHNRPRVGMQVIRASVQRLHTAVESGSRGRALSDAILVEAGVLGGVADEFEGTSTEQAIDRSWALGTLLANIHPLEIERVVNLLSTSDTERLTAIVTRFSAELTQRSRAGA